MKASIQIIPAAAEIALALPYADKRLSAGFPSPAEDFIDAAIDLNKELVKNPSATFYGRVRGNSMKDACVNDGDLLIIDKSIEIRDGKIAVCFIDGEFTVKKIKLGDNCCWLIPANPDYKAVRVTAENDFIIWGIVTYVIKAV